MKDLGKQAQGKVILDGVTVSVGSGGVAIVGENGSGKSSLLRCLTGQWSPTHGAVRIDGQEPARVRERIGYLQDPPAFYEHLTGEEMLGYYVRLAARRWRPELSEELRRWGVPAGPIRRFSRGQRQRLGIVCSLWHEPDYWLLDEPFTGLDGAGRELLWAKIEEWVARGKTVLCVLHAGQGFSRALGRVLALEGGRVRFWGSTEDFLLHELERSEGRVAERWARRLEGLGVALAGDETGGQPRIAGGRDGWKDAAARVLEAGISPLDLFVAEAEP